MDSHHHERAFLFIFIIAVFVVFTAGGYVAWSTVVSKITDRLTDSMLAAADKTPKQIAKSERPTGGGYGVQYEILPDNSSFANLQKCLPPDVQKTYPQLLPSKQKEAACLSKRWVYQSLSDKKNSAVRSAEVADKKAGWLGQTLNELNKTKTLSDFRGLFMIPRGAEEGVSYPGADVATRCVVIPDTPAPTLLNGGNYNENHIQTTEFVRNDPEAIKAWTSVYFKYLDWSRASGLSKATAWLAFGKALLELKNKTIALTPGVIPLSDIFTYGFYSQFTNINLVAIGGNPSNPKVDITIDNMRLPGFGGVMGLGISDFTSARTKFIDETKAAKEDMEKNAQKYHALVKKLEDDMSRLVQSDRECFGT